MNCCTYCKDLDTEFNESLARAELRNYRRRGPARATCLLVETLKAYGVEAKTLLDIGGGIGAIQHELLEAGVQQAISVDASRAYLNAAKEEATQRGLLERVQYFHGNFVDLADEIELVDIVTLDRVICCFPDMSSLVGLSAGRSQAFYGLVFPRDTWWMKGVRVVFNTWMRLRRTSFRFFVHSTDAVDAIVQEQGFEKLFHQKMLIWQVVVYKR